MRFSKVVSAFAAVCITLSALPMGVGSLSTVPARITESKRKH